MPTELIINSNVLLFYVSLLWAFCPSICFKIPIRNAQNLKNTKPPIHIIKFDLDRVNPSHKHLPDTMVQK